MVTDGRDAMGRFAIGNEAATGKRHSTARRNLTIFRAAVSQEAIEELAGILLERARKGDVRAIGLILQYVLPQPSTLPTIDKAIETESRELGRIEDARRRIGNVLN